MTETNKYCSLITFNVNVLNSPICQTRGRSSSWNTTTSLIRSFNWREYLKQEGARYTYKDLSAWEKEAEEDWKSAIREQLAGYCCHWRWREQNESECRKSLLEMARKEVPPAFQQGLQLCDHWLQLNETLQSSHPYDWRLISVYCFQLHILFSCTFYCPFSW